tara:strand:+ start:2815 stop:3291 length:477 start_codon:yes stop_codon:yes gene_type:complete
MAAERGIRVMGVQDVQQSLKKLGLTAKQSRTAINKALRPAANMLARGIQNAYKKEFNTYSGMKSGRTPTWKTIGIITTKSKEPGLLVGPIKRRTTPITVKGKDSYNLAAMQIKGNAIQEARPDVFKQTATRMETKIYLQAESDLDKLLEKMIKQAGFK